jgi:trehalose-phosphatase
LLSACARRNVLVGIVSGRRLSDVKRLVGVRGIWYAGSHGYFLASPDNRRFTKVYPTERGRIARVRRQLQRALASEARIWVEPKGVSLALHYRGASRGSIRRAETVLRSLLARHGGLRLLPGRKVWEVLPAGRVDKWSAVRFITRQSRRRLQTLVFLGDDDGDECVFERLRGISVIVGRPRHTAARFWLRSPTEVRQFLERCLRLWK